MYYLCTERWIGVSQNRVVKKADDEVALSPDLGMMHNACRGYIDLILGLALYKGHGIFDIDRSRAEAWCSTCVYSGWKDSYLGYWWREDLIALCCCRKHSES